MTFLNNNLNQSLKIKKHYLYIVFIILCSGCIERYYPDNAQIEPGRLVIHANLSEYNYDQKISITRSSTFENPKIQYINDCVVYVERSDGMVAEFVLANFGEYQMIPIEGFLNSNFEYRLNILLADGSVYESSYEKMYKPIPLDSLYYEIEHMYGKNDNEVNQGIRFFTDFSIKKENGLYLLWEIEETYEFHNPTYSGFIFDKSRIYRPLYEDESWRTCWITNQLTEYYTLDLRSLSDGAYHGKELNFVSNEPQRLYHMYSLLVNQYTLSKGAYEYWTQLKNNSQESASVFSSQPSILNSNICNIMDEDDIVIGYFSVSGVSSKRIFVNEVEGLDYIENKMYCFPSMKLPAPRQYIPTSSLPRYYSEAWMDGMRYYGETKHHCLDCREYKNSSNIKPDFWKDE